MRFKCAVPAVFSNIEQPCIRLARGKFELTNQDSGGGKKSSVLTSVRKGFEISSVSHWKWH